MAARERKRAGSEPEVETKTKRHVAPAAAKEAAPRPATTREKSPPPSDELVYFKMVTATRAPGKRRIKPYDGVAAGLALAGSDDDEAFSFEADVSSSDSDSSSVSDYSD